MSCQSFPSLVGSTQARAQAVAAFKDFESGNIGGAKRRKGKKVFGQWEAPHSGPHLLSQTACSPAQRPTKHPTDPHWFLCLRNTTFKTQSLSVTLFFLPAPWVHCTLDLQNCQHFLFFFSIFLTTLFLHLVPSSSRPLASQTPHLCTPPCLHPSSFGKNACVLLCLSAFSTFSSPSFSICFI